MRNGEYDGYLITVRDLRRTLRDELAQWYAGDRSEFRAGSVVGLVMGLSALRYGRDYQGELAIVRKDAHMKNREAGLACSCGTIKACPALPDPVELYLTTIRDEPCVAYDYSEEDEWAEGEDL